MDILVTGATGLIGNALIPYLRASGHNVYALTRNPIGKQDLGWDPDSGQLDLSHFQSLDAVVHLAGENIAGGLWTKARKERIYKSREAGTRLLINNLTALEKLPSVLISASGIHYYPHTGGADYDESGPCGKGFLNEVCQVWEAATAPANEKGVRVVNLRLSVVLSPSGGALAKMLPAFKLGLGGRVGDGRQHMSWIAIDDVVDIIYQCLNDERLQGPVNACSPEVVSNREFTHILGEVLLRPTLVPLPERVVRILLGQLGEETLLADFRVYPRKLLEAGYTFRFSSLKKALSHLLER